MCKDEKKKAGSLFSTGTGRRKGGNFVLKDKALSFSLKEPYEFISRKNFSRFKNVVLDSDYFPTRGEGDSIVSCAEGTREKLLQLFVNKSLWQGWRSLSNYVRNFAQSNYIKFSCE